MPTVEFFEIPADDLNRAKKFYNDLFGWTSRSMGESPNNDYFIFNTTNTDGKLGIGGGIMKRQHPQQMICNFVTVPSIEEYSSKVEDLGGKILIPKVAAKGHGYYAVCMDTENNHFGIFQQDTNAK